MLADDQLQLLTASIDGELTPAEARLLRRLLQSSQEAHDLHAHLQADRSLVRTLPQATPPADMVARILTRLPLVSRQSVGATTPPPARLRPAAPLSVPVSVTPPRDARRSQRAAWAPLAIAASLLLAVTGGSFWFFLQQEQPGRAPGSGETARTRQQLPATPEPNFKDILPPDEAPLPSTPLPGNPPEHLAAESAPALTPQTRDVIPPPRPVFTGNAFPPLAPIAPLAFVEIHLPFLATVNEFTRVDTRLRFVEEVGKEPAYRVDLFARDPAHAAEVFQVAAQAVGLGIQSDPLSQERIKRKQGMAYLVYIECLTPLELGDLFTRLATEDQKNPQGVFGSIHAAPAIPADQKELKEILGIDPGLWKRPQPQPPRQSESKSISAGTADQLTRNLTMPPKLPTKSALLLTFAPTAYRSNPLTSREVQQFLNSRPERKPSVVPVLIVIRQATG